MNKLYILVGVGLLLPSLCVSGQRQGDSVNSASWLGTSSVTIGGAGADAFIPIFQGIPLGSKIPGDHFTNYGPYVNRSAAIAKVVLRRTGVTGKGGIVARVNGVVVADNYDAIAVPLAPYESLVFSVKDTATIDLYATRPVSAEELGFPTAADFRHPVGAYLRCVNYYASYDPNLFTGAVYFYIAGTLSDKSDAVDPEIPESYTYGPPPPLTETCGSP